jgi:hypothetical protein
MSCNSSGVIWPRCAVPSVLPRFSTVNRSPTASAWRTLWVMKTTPMPVLRTLSMVDEHIRRLPHAQRRGRLVEDQDLGAEIDRARDGHRLTFAARQRAHRLIGRAEVDAHLAHLLHRDFELALSKSIIFIGPSFLIGSRPIQKFRVTLISGIIARSW